MIGQWKMNGETPVAMGLSVFTLPQGAVVEVTQIDNEHRKALVRVDDRCCDWMTTYWLEKHCTPVAVS